MSTDFLPPDLSQFVKAEVASGRFTTEEQVVIEGVQLLRARSDEFSALRQSLQAADEELDRGDFTEHDEVGLRALAEEIKREGRREYEETRGP